MRRYVLLLFLAGSLAPPSGALAHGTEKHDERPAQAAQPAAAEPALAAPVEERTLPRGAAQAARLSLETLQQDLKFTDFPTLHPMAVHVPVTFIPLALLFALVGLFSLRRVYTGLAFGFTLGGLAGGFVAAFPLHPHTTGLPPAARVTLEKHDLFAYGTLWLALLAALVGLACLWKPGGLRRLLFCAVLLLATLSVSITAHYGGTLAYVHGIGVQGRYLMEH